MTKMSEGKAVPFQISLASARVNAEMTQEEVAKLCMLENRLSLAGKKGLLNRKCRKEENLVNYMVFQLTIFFYLRNPIKMDY